jgi:small subunit ribosomal protein S17|tara:strand:- start:293 stop:589 length:297 start_codon:yes stop_codon:yes gene_type:complete
MVEKTDKKQMKGKKLVGTRGRVFQGEVVKKFDTRVVIEFERTVRIAKYERYAKKKTRIHAKIPENMEVELGDFVKVRECRPLSKIIHFMVTEVRRKKE